ncbi:MAG: universal stress protein [Thermoleophilia bacterium]
MITKILVPTDGSERAEDAAGFAIELAKGFGATVLFINIVDDVSPAFAYELESGISLDIAEIDAQRRRFAQNAVDRLKEKADAAGVACKTIVAEGHPSDAILQAVATEGADHIVIGSHGRRALAAAVLGNVTFNIIHSAKVPVTVIPRP